MSSEIRFLLDGRLVTATGSAPTTTVLEYLRDSLHRIGTKEGCAEGDCGACTVVLGERSADGGKVHYRAVNSCIRLLATIDGQELVTVESLQQADGSLHPVQQAMVDQHASQCGFCTPGFVMSLFALYLQAPQRDARAGTRSLVRQSVPLHGLPPDHRSGLSHGVLSGTGALGPRCTALGCAPRGIARYSARIGAANAGLLRTALAR